MVERSPEFRLIPPGIDDARTRALMVVFAKAASEFDFKALLMRTAAEIPTAFLPLAIHERALDSFFPPDGLPEPVARDLVDNAFDLKEMVGTDPGVLFGLSLLGLDATIRQWWQETPPGHHDTHAITVWAGSRLYDDDEVIVSERTIRAAETMIAATKRHSQDTAFRIGIRAGDASVALAGSMAVAGVVVVRAVISPDITMTGGLAMAGVMALAGVVVVRAVIAPSFDTLIGGDGARLVGADGANLAGGQHS